MKVTVVSSKPDSLSEYLGKIWQHKDLIVTLAKRDLKVKYAQTFIGVSWTLLQPLTALIIFTIFFDLILDIDTGGKPYVIFVLSGLVSWSLFSYVFIQGSNSLVANQEILRKLYFPKMILPLSKGLLGMVEFAISFVLLVIILAFFGTNLGLPVLLLPIPILGILVLGLSLALLLSAATVRYRDLQHIVPFLVTFGIWLTPVFYPVTLIPEQYANWLYINPMAGYIDMFRWCLGWHEHLEPKYLLSFLVTLPLFLAGLILFRNTEDQIVDKL